MGHLNHGEDDGNLNLKPHSSAAAIGCSNGAGYAVTGIIVTQGKDVLYTFDVYAPVWNRGVGFANMHVWKGGCYVAWGHTDSYIAGVSTKFNMDKMKAAQNWSDSRARVRIDCV